jgi:hypothetical protein
VNEGHNICYAYSLGYSDSQVWARIRVDASLPYSTGADGWLSGDAAASWCPQFRAPVSGAPWAPVPSPSYGGSQYV